ncbi:unnamed protein product [Cladocopium goreaui]|uniref:Uncharacterized protein n=1 Tax=Cladocopium goreaui TaxID=2562237 RepID=A0A9P1FLI8_9DINO|nr:unnamed protein product [Cladocopium goreaui]
MLPRRAAPDNPGGATRLNFIRGVGSRKVCPRPGNRAMPSLGRASPKGRR